jgi:Flp pilus assembly protein TadD
VAILIYVVAGLVVLVVVVGLWLIFGRGPRRQRAFRRAGQLLQQGAWQPALAIVKDLQAHSTNSPRWQGRLQKAEGACFRAAGEAAIAAQHYEAGLEKFLQAARLLHLAENEVRTYVVETMLAEVRRLFAASAQAGTAAVRTLIERTLAVQPACAEAFFWQGLCHIHEGRSEPALACLARAWTSGQAKEVGARRLGDPEKEKPAGPERTRAAGAFVDPPLYQGALLLREGRADEALRYLAEANRLDANCPFVTWQLGTAMLAASGDGLIAVKALQRALGPRGLLLWAKNSERAWVEGFPEKQSYVRRLASKHPFSCPLFGSDVALMIRQGQIALGQGYYRLGNFEESAKVFHHLLQESAPSLPVLRGLGLALARLGQFDQAFKHLRAAHDQEESKDFLTAGYLALCGAKGKPLQPVDKIRNVQWAIRLVARFQILSNAEWANLLNQIFEEARTLGLRIGLEDQARLCDTLVSVDAADPLAAAAYGQSAESAPREAQSAERETPSAELRPEYAWLYCRAAQQHGVACDRELDLFARTFATEAEAREFFAQRQWDFDEVEYTYLARCAARQPGAFPAALGPDYATRGERLLLSRSQWLEHLQDPAGAVASAEVLLQLAPHNTAAIDRLAYLAYKAGDLERACALLEDWHHLAPSDHVPLVRRAVIEQQRGDFAARSGAIHQALALVQGKVRADIACLGARLAMQEWLRSLPRHDREKRNGEGPGPALLFSPDARRQVLDLLQECLQEDEEHEAALWCRAAACCVLDLPEELAAQAAAMRRLQEKSDRLDARFEFLAAVCQLAARDYSQVLVSARRAADKDPTLAAEAAYLHGWAYLLLDEPESALRALQPSALDTDSPAHAHAQALLGKIHFAQGAWDDAITWWKSLDVVRRKEWGLEEPLRATLLVAALQALADGRFEESADKVREAGRLGLRDRRLGPLLTLALVKAGQQLLYQNP